MSEIGILIVIFLLAFLIESLVEYLVGEPFNRIEALKPWKWCLMYIAAVVGIVGAFVYRFDLLLILSVYVGVSLAPSPFGLILTGLAIGRGAGYLHSLVKTYFLKPSVPQD